MSKFQMVYILENNMYDNHPVGKQLIVRRINSIVFTYFFSKK
ncbi:hypothetical protein Catovirus_1_378 [Catovirus CTV1]|uniref:Uncharacterized protein n=1 Tax=Catovirus CTV1 TaxID=1977631 RepID=A0A1V0S9K0_9VIRU|nr:hypothetical protein Catovirus_1_378 [Catovirus CTV1]